MQEYTPQIKDPHPNDGVLTIVGCTLYKVVLLWRAK